MNKNINICTIGGGSGMPVVNNSLVDAGFENISSIVTTFDSGGDSGRMRTDERGRIMAYSDYWRALISLWKDSSQKELWKEMLKFRDGRGRNFGNIFFQFMTEKAGGLDKVDDTFVKLTAANMKGQVIPVALKPANIRFITKSGRKYSGEHLLDEMRMSNDMINKIWLEPKVAANPEATKAIQKAEVIIICPGSMYGSVIVNLLPKGIKETLIKSKAQKILMTNIMSMANENNGFDQKMYVEIFEKYLEKKGFFDKVIMGNLDLMDKRLLKKTLSYYELEHSYPIIYNAGYTKTPTVMADIVIIEKTHMRLRHSESKLTAMFKDLLVQ